MDAVVRVERLIEGLPYFKRYLARCAGKIRQVRAGVDRREETAREGAAREGAEEVGGTTNYSLYCQQICWQRGVMYIGEREANLCFVSLFVTGVTERLRRVGNIYENPFHTFLIRAVEEAAYKLAYPCGSRAYSPLFFEIPIKALFFFHSRLKKADIGSVPLFPGPLEFLLTTEVKYDLMATFSLKHENEVKYLLVVLASYISKRLEKGVEAGKGTEGVRSTDEPEDLEVGLAMISFEESITSFLSHPYVDLIVRTLV